MYRSALKSRCGTYIQFSGNSKDLFAVTDTLQVCLSKKRIFSHYQLLHARTYVQYAYIYTHTIQHATYCIPNNQTTL